MIELKHDGLRIWFPEVHEDAVLEIGFQRTLRIPDNDQSYPLPPGLGRFPLRQVDDFIDAVPDAWRAHGGVMLPMYQSEAMWLNFSSESGYPFAVKVAAGKVNAVNGEAWSRELERDPQDYVVVPEQPWLDGYSISKGLIRQFVAMPLGSGYSAEEQITGAAEHGGLQLLVYPMKAEVWERIRPTHHDRYLFADSVASVCLRQSSASMDMGLAPGGMMRQEIYDDPYEAKDWDVEHFSRCFVHIANSLVWSSITGSLPPTTPPTAEQYTRAGLPWFEYYSDAAALEGSDVLRGLRSVSELGAEKGDVPLPENQLVNPKNVVKLGSTAESNVVREGRF